MANQPKIGIYLYPGQEPDALDWKTLAGALRVHPARPIIREMQGHALGAGLKELRVQLREDVVNRVIVAASCSVGLIEPTLHKALRAEGVDPNLAQVVDLSLCTGGGAEAATKRARILLEMALAKAVRLEPKVTAAVTGYDTVLVVGGGIAGLTAAHELAAAGYRVVIVERRPFLGGKVVQLHRYYPHSCDPVCGVSYLLETLRENDRVTIETAAEVAGVTGFPGRFEALVRRSGTESRDVVYTVGAVIIATGWEGFDAGQIKEFGYGKYPNVVTAMDLERLASPSGPTGGRLVRPSDERPVKRVAFIQCAGSRSERYLSYCSQICCTVTIKQLSYIREAYPEAEITVFYIDLRVLGKYEDLYRQALADGVRFVRGMPARIEENSKTRDLVVRAADSLSGRQLAQTVDLVVLATGMVPNRQLEWLSGFEAPDLTHNTHEQCFPGITARPGVYLAGACEEPMDVTQSVRSSLSAAMRCVKFLREKLDVAGLVPMVDDTKCDRCGRCVSECPTGAMRFITEGKPPVPDPLSCRHCGICQGGCPLQCVALPSYCFQGVADMIQAVEFDLLTKDDPAILLFLCRHDAYPAYEAACAAGTVPPNVIPVRVPCAGTVNAAWVADALMHGFDGIAVAGCPREECHAGTGFSLAKERLASAGETLYRMMIEPERVAALPVGIRDAAQLAAKLWAFSAQLKGMGANPLRV
ncbi:methyl-viologen-reducing hydrogenase, delta subunit [Candidatus Desulforudis audaxviator MP104C]|uniref:Methyl-viologen-reducing hydrogenase, delta subunit n=1 Tax=Desulforudis audaxviator (strain MP104C) TaxID=477974 RepID=B1I2U1_DESAP|nr:FAD-dependent oxidoreductase [Candidatus Desulforudis audaxviator]ACA59310.1 methyl-viologen-reducing hydrogenase, delta subunit [Candidatus Desulforudis audaxviator MP104C]